MVRACLQKFIQHLRAATPLPVRQKFGPAIGFGVYVWRVYLTRNRQAPKVLSLEETANQITEKKISMIRFGDGEMSLMENSNLTFQVNNRELATRLKSIIQTNDPGILICIPGIWGRLDGFIDQSFRFILHHLFRYGHVWQSLLSPTKIYGDAYITRPYLGYKDKSKSHLIFKKLFSAWENENVVLLEGEKSRLGIGNDMFSKVKSMHRILCPAENAYDKYLEIKTAALRLPKDTLILISLGPTAKALAYDLCKAGYRVLDIGHIDMEYEMFLRNSPTLVKVPYKYFNEINERDPDDCLDKTYQTQIIARIV